MNRTKIVATIGPATATAEAIEALCAAGMSVARLNGSHNSLDWHASTIRLLRSVVPDVPILLDIPGRKIRTGKLAHEPVFRAGDTVVLTTEPDHDGSAKVPVNYELLHEELAAGHIVLADDGTLRFTVLEVRGRDIVCRAEAAGQLKSAKGINVPQVTLRTPPVTGRDEAMIEFARSNDVDFIGISFVESSEHLARVRDLIGGSWPRIVAKVENAGGLRNLAEVVEATDAIMIDRGDLSVETNLEQLPLHQKRILSVARDAGKPVIVATEMLHTMIVNPFPTKAEVSDITNAVLDGAAATMLSGETAIGAYPSEAVAVMQRISDVAENYIQEELDLRTSRESVSIPMAFGEAIGRLCRVLPITKIVAVTISGFAARMVAAQRPRQPILAVSNDVRAARSFNLLAGTTGYHVDVAFSRTSTDHVAECLHQLWRRNALADEDLILVTAVGYPTSGLRMNLLQTHMVDDLARALSWRR